VQRLLARHQSVLLHPADRASRACTLWTDALLLRTLWRVRAGALIGTRPALNLLALVAARPGLAVVGGEHVNLGAHPPRVRAAIDGPYGRLDALVTLTETDRDAYKRLLGPDMPVLAIPNAAPRMPGPQATLTEPTLIAVGRLTPQKGFDMLIRAFGQVARERPDWTLRICGGGPERRRLEQLISWHGLHGRVTLVGRTTRIPEELEHASVFVLSSRFEGFGMALIEAMSKGLAVISFDCPMGPREIVQDGRAGILVPNRDVDALAEAMRMLMGDEQQRRVLGAAAANATRAYALEAIGPRWDRLLGDLRSAAPRPRRNARVRPGGPPRTLRPAGRRSSR
jgi:glycosyltransferase involved in cell wall biosynthesis